MCLEIDVTILQLQGPNIARPKNQKTLVFVWRE